jgi:hypothetical protein
MMVRRPERVECSAKIAMTVLRGASATMGLLRDYGLRRRIFLEVAQRAILLIMGWATGLFQRAKNPNLPPASALAIAMAR